ncbi:MAG: two-component system response regulator, partial [Dolichospermum sp.]|nr:two-component system response regulator [Dolichospermum sp.]
QSNHRTKHIPVILLTAKIQLSDQRRFASLGIKAVISKPFKPAQLAEQLLVALDWSE